MGKGQKRGLEAQYPQTKVTTDVEEEEEEEEEERHISAVPSPPPSPSYRPQLPERGGGGRYTPPRRAIRVLGESSSPTAPA